VLLLVLLVIVWAARLQDARSVPTGATSTPATTSPPRTTPAALFVGDSYTEGIDAGSAQAGFACLTADAMGWSCELDAQGGTGYVNDGVANSASNEPFMDRLATDKALFPADIVIVDGGRNDGAFPLPSVLAAADTYLRAVRENWPVAQIVVIGPYYVTSTPENYEFGVVFVEAMKDSVARVGGLLVDPLGARWIDQGQVADLLSADGVHPNAPGHRYISDHLVAALKDAGLADLPITDPGPAQRTP
jgi:lysophospholipase L1-like esterase